jgi:hypothetical protein
MQVAGSTQAGRGEYGSGNWESAATGKADGTRGGSAAYLDDDLEGFADLEEDLDEVISLMQPSCVTDIPVYAARVDEPRLVFVVPLKTDLLTERECQPDDRTAYHPNLDSLLVFKLVVSN